MKPHAEFVHWFFAAGILFVGLCLLCEAVVGREVWQMRPWRKYLWPGTAFAMGVLLWPVMAFFTNSAIHMYAHGSWAEVLMLAGGAELGLVHGRLKSPYWRLTWPLAFLVTGTAFIVHEQNPWFFARAAVPASPDRVDVHDRRAHSTCAGRRPRSPCWACFALTSSSSRSSSSPTATLRPSSGTVALAGVPHR